MVAEYDGMINENGVECYSLSWTIFLQS